MYRLRQALRHISSTDYILHSGKRYQMAESLVSTDRKRFERLAARVLKEDASPEAVSYLEEMVSLYRCLLYTSQAEALLISAFRQAQEQNDGLALSYIAETLGNLNYIQGECQEALRIFELGVEAFPESR